MEIPIIKVIETRDKCLNIYCYLHSFLKQIKHFSMENLFIKKVVTPCILVEKTGGLSSDVHEMGNVR